MSHKTAEQERSNDRGVLYVALELGGSQWWLASSDGSARAPRLKSVAAGDLEGLALEWKAARKRFGLSPGAPIRSCYEAGRDGFWVHRALARMGVDNRVVDSSSIEVNRRHRRAKTDRLDARKLLKLLLRFCQGESDVWSVVRVPSESSEDDRRAGRERASLKKEATRLGNRLRALLKTQGCDLRGSLKGLDLSLVRDWEGKPLRAHLHRELARIYERWTLCTRQLQALEAEQKAELKARTPVTKMVGRMMALQGIGPVIAWSLVTELFAWRQFKNGRQVGAALGLTGTPYRSDGTVREQGISKAGNPRLRSLLIQAAWGWLRFQPKSALTQWFHQRFSQGPRLRRIGIVAVARKLAIALWRYIDQGVLPEGAVTTAPKEA